MKLANIILPNSDNEGHTLMDLHRGLTRDLIETFGGCTSQECNGCWKNPDGKIYVEPVTSYAVAMDDTPVNHFRLEELAYQYGNAARQEAVYVQYANGEVEFVTMLPVTAE